MGVAPTGGVRKDSIALNRLSAGASPQTLLGSLQRSPEGPDPLAGLGVGPPGKGEGRGKSREGREERGEEVREGRESRNAQI